MNRIKLLAISTVTATMILGSSIVLATEQAPESTGTSVDAPSMMTDLQADPNVRRGGGGAGHTLRK